MNNSRNNILNRLKKTTQQTKNQIQIDEKYKAQLLQHQRNISYHDKKTQFINMIQAVHHAQVYHTNNSDYTSKLIEIISQKQIQSIIYPDDFPENQIEAIKQASPINLIPFSQPIESFKKTLFQVDAGITCVKGAIAETGSLILSPNSNSPRSLSLVPPIHIAVLNVNYIYNNLIEFFENENINQQLPTNLVLISGPSKTADIEFVLTFGAHGPKELIVILIDKNC